MKKLTLLLSLLVALTAGLAFAAEEEEEVVVTARLVEIPGTMPPNDLYNYVYILKYKVIKVEKGELKEKEILVGHYNPLKSRSSINDKMKDKVDGNLEKFVAGEKHTLTLKKPLEKYWAEAVEDEYFDDEAERWYCIKVDKAK